MIVGSNPTRLANKETPRDGSRQISLANRSKSNAYCAFRRALKKNATPMWLTDEDKQSIHELFVICSMFKIYTGQEYHVDHIVPLAGENVCGLHVPWNLQILTAKENISKKNKFNG